MLLNTKTDVPVGERLKESLRSRETIKRTIQQWFNWKSLFSRSRRRNAKTITLVLSAMLDYLSLLPLMSVLTVTPSWWVLVTMFLLGVRPVDPRTVDQYGEMAIMWPNIKRTYLRRQLRPPQSQVFSFLQQWVSDPVHIKMLTYMTSNIAPDSNAYKVAEDTCLRLLNHVAWRHEVGSLSTESELLERQVLERSNFNILKRLVQCRKTTKRVKDGIENFCSHTPATSFDWAHMLRSWNVQQQARSNKQRHRNDEESVHQDGKASSAALRERLREALGMKSVVKLQQTYLNFFPTPQAEENPVESFYWQGRIEETSKPGQDTSLTLEHVEDTLSRSLSLLQNAIAVQTSDRALWLALIATFYFPATLATGIFGMNLSLIDGKPYWWAIVVCAIMFVPNVAFLIYVFGRT